MRSLVDLAPLHNAPALAAIDAARAAFPDLPQVAVFDTEFHATLPDEASTYAVPERWRTQWHIRRYGFHGLSVQWAAEQVPVARLVVCHLGGGCSVSAVRDGRSIDTTMGFSPLEGVPMATRSGSLDPAAILYLLRAAQARSTRSTRRSSASRGCSDCRASPGASRSSSERASPPRGGARRLLLPRRVRASARWRSRSAASTRSRSPAAWGRARRSCGRRCARASALLGVELDEERNEAAPRRMRRSRPRGSRVRVVVVRAREDVVAARAVRRILADS